MPDEILNSCPLCLYKRSVLLTRRKCDATWFLARCSACGLHYTYPPPSLEQIRSFYSGEYHRELRNEGASEAAFLPKMCSYRDWLLQYIKSGRSLDIGCATGLFPKLLSDIGFTAEGIEINAESAEWGRLHYGVAIHTGSFNELSLNEHSYDLITLTDVLEHTPHPVLFLRGLSKYLTPNGLVFITFPDVRSIESRYYYCVSKLLRREWLWEHNRSIPCHIWGFTQDTAHTTFKQAGFRVLAQQRRQIGECSDLRLRYLWEIIHLPPLLLRWGPIANRWGSQMRFLVTPELSVSHG